MTKKECRTILRDTWANLKPDELHSSTQNIHSHILTSGNYQKSDCIVAYLSFKGEISLDALIQKALIDGKAVAIPRVEGKSMVFHSLKEWDESQFIVSKWGIREPQKDAPRIAWNGYKKILILTPGLGFTLQGLRMGRGGGYYDRFLPGMLAEKATLMGITIEKTILKDIPSQSHDVRVDLICTEKGLKPITTL